MGKKRERDEYLEQLWYMKEEGKVSIDALKSALGTGYDADITNELYFTMFLAEIMNQAPVSLSIP